MKPVLEIKNISKHYRISGNRQPYLSLRDSVSNVFKGRTRKQDFWALDNISFDVMPGDTLGIIGKNGAGKSTLLKILSRITPPTAGNIKVRGRIASLLEVGTGFHPELTGRENIFLNGSILGMRRHEIQKNFDEIVSFAGVAQFIDTPLKHYSSGMQLRLAFSVAAFLENEILVIDEVLAVGDAEFQKKCLGKMEDVSKSGRTILFVSHSMSAIRELCSQSLMLKQGKLFAKGSTEDIISAYMQENQVRREIDIAAKENKTAYLSAIYTHGMAGDTGSPVYPDQDCYFTLTIHAAKDIQNAQVGIGLNDRMNNRVVTLYTRHNRVSVNLRAGVNTLTCKIQNLPLKPDVYSLHVMVGSDFEIYDYHGDVAEMEVTPAPFYYKEIPDQSQGAMIIKQEWSLH